MAYTKVDWTEAVPITAANLDQMDTGMTTTSTNSTMWAPAGKTAPDWALRQDYSQGW